MKLVNNENDGCYLKSRKFWRADVSRGQNLILSNNVLNM